nr:hypothetical protein [Tanacetum cinerariifolium]
SSTQPEPKSAPAKTQGKKRKLTTKISDKPSKVMKSRHGLVSKRSKPLSSLRSVDESVDKDVPAKEPQVDDEAYRDLPAADMKEILHQRMWETDSYKSHEDHMQLYEALEKSMNRDHFEELTKYLAKARPSEASGSLGAYGSSQVPPPPPSTNQESQSKGSVTPSSSKTAASAEYQTWMTTAIRLRPSLSLTPADLQMDEDMALDEQVQSSDEEYIGNAIFLR